MVATVNYEALTSRKSLVVFLRNLFGFLMCAVAVFPDEQHTPCTMQNCNNKNH